MSELETFGNVLESKMGELKDEIKQLERFRDDLKCCGNCADYLSEGDCLNSGAKGYCKKWRFDGMSQGDRRIL